MGKSTGSDIGEVPSKGVRKRGNKWVAEIRNRHLRGGRHPGRKWLGTFSTAAGAREAYARAVKKIKSSQRPPGSVKSLEVPHTNTLCSSLSSSASTGGKRRPERIPYPDVTIRSKKARKRICLDNDTGSASLSNEELVPIASPVTSMHHEELIKDCASFDQEGCKGTVTMHTSATSSSSDSPPVASQRSSSATSRWMDEELKNHSFDDSFLGAEGEGKKDFIDESHAYWLFEITPPTSQVLSEVCERAPGTVPGSNDAPEVSTIFCYSSTVIDDSINSYPLVPRDRYCASAEQTNAYPMCRCSLVCTTNQKCSPASSYVCNYKNHLYQNNRKENVEDYFLQNKVFNQEQSSLPESEDQPLQFCEMKVKSEDFAAFKTRYILSELKAAQLIPEFRSSELPQRDAELSEFTQLIRRSTAKEFRNTGTSPLFRLPPAASSAVSNSIPAQQAPFVETLNPFRHAMEPELVEPDPRILDTACLSSCEGAFTSETWRRSDGLSFLPVDDLLEYF